MAKSTAVWKFRVERRDGTVISNHKVGWRAAARLRSVHAKWMRYDRVIPRGIDPETGRSEGSQSPFRLIEVATGRVPTDPWVLSKPKKQAPLRQRTGS